MPSSLPRLAAAVSRAAGVSDEPGDRVFDLDGLSLYSGLAVATLRSYIHDPDHPLPAHQLHDRRLFVFKRDFDAWVRSFPAPAPRGRSRREPDPGDASWVRELVQSD